MIRPIFSLIVLCYQLVDVEFSQVKAPSPGILSAVATQVRQSEDRTRPTGSISGRIINESGQPMVGAGIFIRSTAFSSNLSRTVTADEEGRFQADGLPAAQYTVSATAVGYVPDGDMTRTRRIGDVVTIRMVKGGVITGTVTNSHGEAVMGARVAAVRVRDGNGRKLRASGGPSGWTDDRGVYRIYGLGSGSYLVGVNAGTGYSTTGYAFDGDVPVYHPAATRDSATEVKVQVGQEVTGIDIRYRGERGHSITGRIAGSIQLDDMNSSVGLSLTVAATGVFQSSSSIFNRDSSQSFAFHGIPDGEYQLLAVLNGPIDASAASQPRKITVKGADVAGIEVTLSPLGSIAGKVTIEQFKEGVRPEECKAREAGVLEEAAITVRRDVRLDRDRSTSQMFWGGSAAPDTKGEFSVYRLAAGRHHVSTQLSEDWYVRSMTLPGTTREAAGIDVTKEGFSVASGQRISNLGITVALGAAGLSGRVVPASERAKLPSGLLVHLVPAERESADQRLRFAEVRVDVDGTFSLSNLAPGRYFILVRAIPEDEWMEGTSRAVASDSEGRMKLSREAETANVVMELRQCERVVDYTLKYNAPAAPSRPSPGRRN